MAENRTKLLKIKVGPDTALHDFTGVEKNPTGRSDPCKVTKAKNIPLSTIQIIAYFLKIRAAERRGDAGKG